jgi:hypothetical protein
VGKLEWKAFLIKAPGFISLCLRKINSFLHLL